MESRHAERNEIDDKEMEQHIEQRFPGKETPSDYMDSFGSVRPSLEQRLKRHYKKWWWLHLIVIVAVVLIATLPLVYIAFPRIAQNDKSFHLHQVNVIRSDNAYHPQLDAFNASLSLQGNDPYAKVFIQSVHATAEATTTIDQDVQITNLDQFTDFNVELLDSKQVNLAVNGKTKLHEMRFPATTVNYNKVVTMKGLNKLQGFNITSFQVKLSPDPDGTNAIGEIYILNPTVITVEMGNVTFNTYCEGDFIGNSTLSDLTLRPGNNIIAMRSIVNQTLVLTKLTTNPNFRDGFLPIDIVGNSSIYSGTHLTYFEKALQSNTQHVLLNVGQALSAIGINITNI